MQSLTETLPLKYPVEAEALFAKFFWSLQMQDKLGTCL